MTGVTPAAQALVRSLTGRGASGSPKRYVDRGGGPVSTEPVEPASPRRRIKEMEVMVADVISETPDTATLVLFTGNDRLDYQPGHFLTVDPHQFESLQRLDRKSVV